MSIHNIQFHSQFSQFYIDSKPTDQDSFEEWNNENYTLSPYGVAVGLPHAATAVVNLTVVVDEKVKIGAHRLVIQHHIEASDKRVFFYSPDNMNDMNGVTVSSEQITVTVIRTGENDYTVHLNGSHIKFM